MTRIAILADGAPLGRPVSWQDWNADPVVVLNLAMLIWLYARGWSHLQRGRQQPRGRQRRIGTSFQLGCFAAGIVVTAIVLLSPLDPLGEQLASAHMIQHMVLMTVAAPLLVLGAAARVCFCGLPPLWRRVAARCRRWRVSTDPLGALLVIWSVHAVGLWVWHLPRLYGGALSNSLLHDAQHLTFFVIACLFWRPLLAPEARYRVHGGIAVVYLFTTTLHATVLGVLMTIAPTVWYPEYIGRAPWWGMTPLEDQQLAGLIMWMPACFPYALAAVALFARAVQESAGEIRLVRPVS